MNITIRHHRGVPSAVLALLLLLGAAAVPVPASAAPLVFSDGFESGTLGAWTMVRGVTPDGGAHDGAWGARATGVAGPAWAYVALPATYPELYARTWFSVTSTSGPLTLLRFRNTHGGVQIAAGTSKSGLLTIQNSRTGTTVSSSVVVTVGVWHEVQIHALMAKGTAGRFDVWFDGAPVPELSGVQKVGPTPVGRVQIGDNVARTFDVNFDDVAVDTAFIDGAPPVDTGPPTEPVISSTTAPSSATVRITWNAATDDVGVTGYDVFRSAGGPFTAVGSTTGATSFVDPTVQPDSDYAYKVDAFDAAGHHSTRSNPSSVHTPVDTPTPPNVVLIVTDDQRYDMLGHMANVQVDLVDQGVTFPNGFVSDSLCCPSRTSTLRGQYSHTTGVYDIDGPYGGWPRVRSLNLESSTLATWLQADGYRTSLIGKYLNDYSDPTYVPPGWDFWRVSTGDSYFNYTVSENGVPKRYGSTPDQYKTAVLSNYADQFIRSTPASQPLFLDLAPSSPHDPATPEPKYAADPRCDAVSETGSPAFDETDTKDKPFYVRHRPPLPDDKVLDYGTTRPQAQCRALLSVDDMVQTVMTAMNDTGRTNDTLFIYTSDNGLMNGDHRLPGKKAPYESSIRVPFIVRYDPMTTPGSVDPHMVVNVDIAPTITDLLGLDITPGCPTPAYSETCTGAFDGRSFLPLLDGTPVNWRTSFLIEHYETASPGSVPPFCGVRTDTYKLVRYATGEEELYDLAADPYELQNLMAGTLTPEQQSVHDQLFQELFGPGGMCDPPPPDYPLPPAP